MTTETKLQSESEFIQQLKQNGYERVAISDNDLLHADFCTQINKFNEGKLKGNNLLYKESENQHRKIVGKGLFELKGKLLINYF